MINATQITTTAKVQNETYLASLKLAGYLKLNTPSIVAAARIADSYNKEMIAKGSGLIVQVTTTSGGVVTFLEIDRSSR